MRDERHREPARALPGPPRRDPQAARVVQRGGESGARGLRGTAPLPATRARVAAERARTDPPAQGRHHGCGGGPAGRSSRRVGSPTGSRAGASGPRRRGHRGCLHPRRRSSVPCGCRRRSGHRTPTCSARRCSRRRSRSRSRPATSAGLDRPPTSWSSIAARFESKALVAGAALARGRVRLAEGDAAGAEQSLSEAVGLWNEVGAPYEAALRTHRPRRGPCRQRQRAPGRSWSAKRPARSSKGSKPRRLWPHR